MKRFVLYKVAILLLLFTLPVCVVSMDMTLEEAWKVVNEDCKLNIPKSATLEEVDSAKQSLLDLSTLKAFDKNRLFDAVFTIKEDIKVKNASKWVKDNIKKITAAINDCLKKDSKLLWFEIKKQISDIIPSVNNKSFDYLNTLVTDQEIEELIKKIVEEQQKPSAHVEQPSLLSKAAWVDYSGSEPKMPTSSQSQSAKPNAHQLRRVTLPGALDSATTVLVEQWLNYNNDYLEDLITDYFENKKSQGHTVARIKSGDVLDDVIDNLKKDSESYQKLEDSDKIVLHNRIKALLIPDIQKRFNQENELRPRQQLFDFNPNDSNMVTAALELASMLNR